MNYIFSIPPFLQFVDANGNPVANGKLYTYLAGTSDLEETFADVNGTANTNPIILDNMGKATVILDKSKSYKFALYDQNDVLIFTQDNINYNAITQEVIQYDNINELREVTGTTDGQLVFVRAYYNTTLTGGGYFYWDEDVTADDNNGTIIKPNAVTGAGRWIRLLQNDKIDIAYFGIAPGLTNVDDTLLIIDYLAYNLGYRVFINSGEYAIYSNIDFDSVIEFGSGGILKPVNCTITMRAIINDDKQHFNGVSNGIVRLTNYNTLKVEWFGAVGDGSFTNNTVTTNDTTAMQFAINSLTTGQSLLINTAKKYTINGLTLKGGITIRGEGMLSAVDGDYYSNLFLIDNTNDIFLDLSGTTARGITLENLAIDGNNNDTILALDSINSYIKNCIFKNADYGIKLSKSTDEKYNNVINCVFKNISNTAVYGNGAVECFIIDNIFIDCSNEVNYNNVNSWVIKTTTNKFNKVAGNLLWGDNWQSNILASDDVFTIANTSKLSSDSSSEKQLLKLVGGTNSDSSSSDYVAEIKTIGFGDSGYSDTCIKEKVVTNANDNKYIIKKYYDKIQIKNASDSANTQLIELDFTNNNINLLLDIVNKAKIKYQPYSDSAATSSDGVFYFSNVIGRETGVLTLTANDTPKKLALIKSNTDYSATYINYIKIKNGYPYIFLVVYDA